MAEKTEIRKGITDSFSVGLGIFPLGIGLGFLVVQTGLPWWVAPALSLGVFAGSVEFMMVGLLASVTPLITIAVTVFAVNFRHVFYAFSFPIDLVKPGPKRAYSIYAMIDEAYATAVMIPRAQLTGMRLLAMQISCQAYWVVGTLVGIGIAKLIPQTLEGFEFALVALFTVMTLDSFRGKKQLPQALIASLSVSVALIFTKDSAILTALILFFFLLVARFLLFDRNEEEPHPAKGGDDGTN